MAVPKEVNFDQSEKDLSRLNKIIAASYGVQGLAEFGAGLSQAAALRAQGRYQASMMLLNAELARMQAEDALERGEQTAENYGRQAAQVKGAQRTAFAASGVDVNSGSAAQIQEETAEQAVTDLMTIRSNAWRESWGFKMQEIESKGQAEMAKIGASQKSTQTILTGLVGLGKGMSNMGYTFANKKSNPWG